MVTFFRFDDIKNTLHIRTNFQEYNGLINPIKGFLRTRNIKIPLNFILFRPIHTFQVYIFNSYNKLYDVLIINNLISKAQNKSETKFNVNQLNSNDIHIFLFKSCKNLKLPWLQ